MPTRHRQQLDWTPALGVIAKSTRLVLTTHVRPDPDGIGSEIALDRELRRMGKDSRILNQDELLPNLALLDPDGRVRMVQESDRDFVLGATVIVLDVSERERLGPIGSMLTHHAGPSLCIDHHIRAKTSFATFEFIDPTAPSTGVLVWELLRELGADIDAVTAQAIFATIVADTGSFRHSNTTSEVMRLAADLIELGASPPPVARAVLGAFSEPKMRLLAGLLSNYQRVSDGRLSYHGITLAAFRAAEASDADAEGLVEYLRLAAGVEVGLLFLELADGRVKVSFRCQAPNDVNAIARRYGGGGHKHASGATLNGPLEQAMAEVVAATQELFR